MNGWTDLLGPVMVVGLVGTFLKLLLSGDIRLGREVTRLEAESAQAMLEAKDALKEERDQKRTLQDRLDASAVVNAELQAATAETARQQAAVINMLLNRPGGGS